MTNEELVEIRKRAEDATPGPWRYGAVPRSIFVETDDSYCIAEKDSDKVIDYNNAEFIAHAREDIPKLLAEIDCLKNSLDSIVMLGHAMTVEDYGVALSVAIETARKTLADGGYYDDED